MAGFVGNYVHKYVRHVADRTPPKAEYVRHFEARSPRALGGQYVVSGHERQKVIEAHLSTEIEESMPYDRSRARRPAQPPQPSEGHNAIICATAAQTAERAARAMEAFMHRSFFTVK